MPLPAIRILRDGNPTAFCYCSLPSNARVAFSTGIFDLLDDEEVSAVAAHELGHIRHYDAAVMTAATVLLQLIYQAYVWLTRNQAGDSDREDYGWYIGVAAYLAWLVGQYLLLWLSRSREYMADRFAAMHMGDQASLQRALVKIGYGLAQLQVKEGAKAAAAGQGSKPAKSKRGLLESTRSMGITDPRAAAGVGNAMRMTHGSAAVDADADAELDAFARASHGGSSGFRADLIEPVFLFDLYNPWAFVTELSSSHPLTGKRLRALDDMAEELHKPRTFDFQAIDRQGQQLDQGALYGDFTFEVVIWFLPALMPVLGAPLYMLRPDLALGIAVALGGLAMFMRQAYSYAVFGAFEPITVYELMCDPYASPLRGRPVQIEGEIIGKTNAGSKVAEDVTMRDRSGALIQLDYQSPIPVFGNLWFGWKTVKQSLHRPAVARGWFRRGIGQNIDLYDLKVDGSTFGSYNRFWNISMGLMVMLLGSGILGVQLAMGGMGGDSVDDVQRTEDGVEVW